jgi:hypothetical protein
VIDRVTPAGKLLDESITRAAELGKKQAPAFRSIKNLLRRSIADEMAKREGESLREFSEIWCSDVTRAFLREISIRD